MLNGYDYENYLAMGTPFSFNPDGSLTEQSAGKWNPDGTVKHSGINHNWQKEVLRPAFTHKVNASVNGGSGNVSYALTAGYLDKDGIAIGSEMDRFTFGSKVNVKVKKWLRLGLDLKGSRTRNDGIVSADQFIANNVFAQMLIFNPAYAGDDFNDDLSSDGNNPRNHPLVNARDAVQRNISNRIQGQVFAEFNIVKGLTFKTSFGGYMNNTKTKNFYPAAVGNGSRTNGLATHGSGNVTNWIQENILNYNRTFNKIHNQNAMVGFTMERTINEKLKITTKDLMSDNLNEEKS